MLFEKVRDLGRESERLRQRRYGIVEMVDARLSAVHLRPFPKLATPETLLWGRWYHQRRRGDVCRLYYNQPLSCPGFIALKYALSSADCSLATFRGALRVLDEIARIKQTNAIVCDVANWRISDRLLNRGGWEPHCPSRWHRHFIKRFYGHYPPPMVLSS